MPFFFRFRCLCAAVSLLALCWSGNAAAQTEATTPAALPPAADTSPVATPQDAAALSDFKRVPFGRSDGEAPFFRTHALQAATDADYGRSPDKPIRLGPRQLNAHLLFLNSLRGPQGQPLAFERQGSCCQFQDSSLELGGGLLDLYLLRIDGQPEPLVIYIDAYHRGPPAIPVGLTQRKFRP